MTRVIEWIGTHPFATGLLAVLGLVTTIFTFYDSYASTVENEKTREQLTRLEDLGSQTKESSSRADEQANIISTKIDDLSARIETEKTAATGFIPIITELPYHKAREKVLEVGWMPIKRLPQTIGNYDFRIWPLWNYGFQEVDHCFPTGRGDCSFLFHNGIGKRLTVTTTGEYHGRVDETGRKFIDEPDFAFFQVHSAFIDDLN